MLTHFITENITSYSLTPSWSPDERICPTCKAMYAPCLRIAADVNNAAAVDWRHIGQAKEQSRIVVPQMFGPGRLPGRG